MENGNQEMKMKCPKCGCTDLQILNNAGNTHSSWVTGRVVTTGGGVVAVCKNCGATHNLNDVRYKSDKEKTAEKNNQVVGIILGIIAIVLLVYLFNKIYSGA